MVIIEVANFYICNYNYKQTMENITYNKSDYNYNHFTYLCN